MRRWAYRLWRICGRSQFAARVIEKLPESWWLH
jgi:hypothetical protein